MSLLGLQRQGTGPTFVWLHGFTQTKDSAHQFRSILAGSYEVLTIDLPGHGQNARIDATLNETADLLADALPPEPFILGGYSFGGRVALHFALRYPTRLNRLVVLGATRGIQDPDERSERRSRDETLADHIELVGVDVFLDEWLDQKMFAGLPIDPIERAARSTDAEGLANSLRFAGSGTQSWLAPQLPALDVETLTIAGRDDLKFSAVALAIAATVRHGHHQLVEKAHHAAHLEQPEATALIIRGHQPQ
jgi:2-succinyl-6-hydroxy-2,4-cyclohexadiene-1-carboxylate synthase